MDGCWEVVGDGLEGAAEGINDCSLWGRCQREGDCDKARVLSCRVEYCDGEILGEECYEAVGPQQHLEESFTAPKMSFSTMSTMSCLNVTK